MKQHKAFHAALLVSIQERQAQYPEMTDADFERALRTLADRSERERRRRVEAERLAAFRASMGQPRQGREAADLAAEYKWVSAQQREASPTSGGRDPAA